MSGTSRGTCNFNPRSSCEERQKGRAEGRPRKMISIHAPHARSDASGYRRPDRRPDFNPRSSCEERLFACDARLPCHDFNPRSSCEERQDDPDYVAKLNQISIHAPHARSDIRRSKNGGTKDISIHAPHARSDVLTSPRTLQYVSFQSTLLMRGATRKRKIMLALLANFNPRSSCEERLSIRMPHPRNAYFNPRSSCEERPLFIDKADMCLFDFNPRSSCEERRHKSQRPSKSQYFNPRSSCEERHERNLYDIAHGHFNPRSSCEERLRITAGQVVRLRFQSTLLMRGATLTASTINAESS